MKGSAQRQFISEQIEFTLTLFEGWFLAALCVLC
jgi:hypothetical protein